MQKFITLSLVMLVSSLMARPVQQATDPFIQLLQQHQQQVNAYFLRLEANSGFEKAFFSDISFASDQQIEAHLKKIATTYEKQGSVGRSFVSFSRFVSINGQTSAISYTLTNDGHNIHLVRTTNYNGQVLKAVYNYDIKAKVMTAGLQQNDKIFLKEDYSL